MPLQRRIPKRGFTNIFRIEYQVVNVGDLAKLTGEVNLGILREHGLIRSLRRPVKVLGNGDLAAALTVSAHAFSESATRKIEAAGGSATVLDKKARA